MRVPRDITEINKLRKISGLPLLKPGISKCIRCGKEIESNDRIGNRICGACRYRNKHTYTIDPQDSPLNNQPK